MVLKVVSFYIIHYVTLNGCGPLHNASSKTGTRKGAREQTFSIGNKSSKLVFTPPHPHPTPPVPSLMLTC